VTYRQDLRFPFSCLMFYALDISFFFSAPSRGPNPFSLAPFPFSLVGLVPSDVHLMEPVVGYSEKPERTPLFAFTSFPPPFFSRGPPPRIQL